LAASTVNSRFHLSTDLLNAAEVAATLSQVLQRDVPAVILTPDFYDDAYASSALSWLQQTCDGRLSYSAITTTTVHDLLGREPIHLNEWAARHRDELLAQLR
jgi:hypothetical protein